MGNESSSHDNIHFFEIEEVSIDRIECDGWILDIGGGGEGVIGRLMGNSVIAIDPLKRELEEAASGPLKVVMDATDLQFLDETFPVVTSFFTLMYIKRSQQMKVFEEVYRVLKPGGEFLIWDGVLPSSPNDSKEFAAFRLRVILPEVQIETGYGTRWPAVTKDADYYGCLAEQAGFELVESDHQKLIFRLRLRKNE